ncbi:hypothetical protein SALBM217S_03075 [Streptomyces griseoloalbus]
MTTPDIRVEKGHAEPEEVAAIAAILMARAASAPAAEPAHGGGTRPAGRLAREPGFRPATAGADPNKGPLLSQEGPFCKPLEGRGELPTACTRR